MRRGIRVEISDPGWGELRLTNGGRIIHTRESLPELTSAVAMSRCDDKRVTRRILAEAGLRVPRGRTATGAGDRALDIPVTGLDLLVGSPDRPEHVFIEANERPGLANHEPQPTAEHFVDLLFPGTRHRSGSGRPPVRGHRMSRQPHPCRSRGARRPAGSRHPVIEIRCRGHAGVDSVAVHGKGGGPALYSNRTREVAVR